MERGIFEIGDTEETQDKEAVLKSRQAELAKLSQKIDGYIAFLWAQP